MDSNKNRGTPFVDRPSEEFERMWELLLDDVEAALELVASSDRQPYRRSLVRTVFAAIEGTVFLLRREVLARKGFELDYSLAEQALLREEQYALAQSGKPVIQQKFLRTDQNLVFTLQMFMRGTLSEAEIDKSGVEWASFLEAIKIRHRVTHPRTSPEMHVSDEEYRRVVDTFHWFVRLVMQNSVRGLKTAVTKLQQIANGQQGTEAAPGDIPEEE